MVLLVRPTKPPLHCTMPRHHATPPCHYTMPATLFWMESPIIRFSALKLVHFCGNRSSNTFYRQSQTLHGFHVESRSQNTQSSPLQVPGPSYGLTAHQTVGLEEKPAFVEHVTLKSALVTVKIERRACDGFVVAGPASWKEHHSNCFCCSAMAVLHWLLKTIELVNTLVSLVN